MNAMTQRLAPSLVAVAGVLALAGCAPGSASIETFAGLPAERDVSQSSEELPEGPQAAWVEDGGRIAVTLWGSSTCPTVGTGIHVVKPAGAERLQISIKNALKLNSLEDEVRRMRRRASGTLGFRDELLAEVPRSLIELMRLPGLGPKKARRVWDELKIGSVDELEAAAKEGRIATLAGRSAWTPALRGNGVQVGLGSGGVASGRAHTVGKEMDATWFIQLGSTGVDGKTGTLTLTLPPGVTSAGSFQSVPCKIWCPRQNRHYIGVLEVAPSATQGTIIMPSAYNDVSAQPARNTDPATPTQAGTGIPRIDVGAGGPDYVLQDNGSLYASGRLEIA